jgi:hypothetical protein
VVVQTDGKILVGGGFTTVAGQPRIGIARLDPTIGIPDSFNPGASNTVYSIAIQQSDGKVLLGGDFTIIGVETRNYVARVGANAPTATPTSTPTPACLTVTVYSGFTETGGGTPYSVPVGTFMAGDVLFGTRENWAWHPFDQPRFGADITGDLTAAAGGSYEFALDSDDGSLLFIDGNLVVDNGGPRTHGISATGTASLTAGTHAFEIQFFESFDGPSGVDMTLPAGVSYATCPQASTTPTSTATATATNTPTPATVSISGTVTYGNAAAPPKYISNVLVSGAGSTNVMTATGAPGPNAGQYLLTGFASGAYTVSLSKTTGQNSITSNDAARIAQHVAGISILTTNDQKVSADVTGNNAISSQDAAKIAQFVAGLPSSPPNLTSVWEFYLPPGPTFPVGSSPTSRTYPAVTGSFTGEDYIGLLIGEVTGNWVPGAARPAGTVESGKWKMESEETAVGPEKGIGLELSAGISGTGKEIIVPVAVNNIANKGVISYEFDLRYDPSVLQPAAEPVKTSGTTSRALSVVTNAGEPGLLRVVVYGAVPIGEDGVLLNLRFTVIGAAGAVSQLSFERIMFNEGEPRVAVTGGQVEIAGTD